MGLAWLSDGEEFEIEETGELQCECKADFSNLQDIQTQLLTLLMDIVLAGDPMNLQRLLSQLMMSESWQVVYSCAVNRLGERRYLAIDRDDLELPVKAVERLEQGQGQAIPLADLFAQFGTVALGSNG